MNRKLLVFCCLLASYTLAFAQQDAQYTMYFFNSLAYNPAYAGSVGLTSLTAIYRHQWAGFDGAPRTFAASIHSPIANQKMGLGFMLENDRLGIHNRLSAFGSYAYHIPMNDKVKLSLGLNAGMLYYTSNWADAPNPIDITDPNFQNTQTKVLPNIGLGAYLYSERYYVGLSVPHLLEGTLDNISALSKYDRHYFLTGGVVIDLNDKLRFKPSALLKYVPNAPLEADINLSFLLNDALWLGAAFHTGTGIAVPIIQYQFKNGLRLGYSYDYNLNGLAGSNSGSHEVMLGWDFAGNNKGGNAKDKVLSPRFF